MLHVFPWGSYSLQMVNFLWGFPNCNINCLGNFLRYLVIVDSSGWINGGLNTVGVGEQDGVESSVSHLRVLACAVLWSSNVSVILTVINTNTMYIFILTLGISFTLDSGLSLCQCFSLATSSVLYNDLIRVSDISLGSSDDYGLL